MITKREFYFIESDGLMAIPYILVITPVFQGVYKMLSNEERFYTIEQFEKSGIFDTMTEDEISAVYYFFEDTKND